MIIALILALLSTAAHATPMLAYHVAPEPMHPVLMRARPGVAWPDLPMPDMATCQREALKLASMPALSIIALCVDRTPTEGVKRWKPMQ